jgi:hypothetical protein
VDRAEVDQIERVINRELKERFAEGAVRRAVLLQHGDDPAIGPGELLVRVLIPALGRPEDYEQALAAWQDAHRTGMEELRRELSLRLPPARLLEFTFDDPGAATPRIMMPDDGSLAAEQLSGREIVTRALSLLRANYVFPELAEQAATAVEARLVAGEYDDLDESMLAERLTSQLQEITGDKHLRMLGGGPRYVDRPVYVLTSSRTFSGGEDFCYTLQALGRAELIGETTGGGAHPTRGFPISLTVHIGIPFARSINPVTGTNWQGTGVVPDIAVPEAEAYDVAYARALRHVLTQDDVFPPIQDEAREALAGLSPAASPLAEPPAPEPPAPDPPVTDPPAADPAAPATRPGEC